MQYQTPHGSPQWNDGGDERMFISMLLATLVVAAVLSVLRLPVVPDLGPIMELIVRIVEPAADQKSTSEEATEPTVADEPADSPADSPPAATGEIVEPTDSPLPGIDWDAARERASTEYVESQRDNYGYFDPRAAETRRERSRYYQPPVHPPKKQIWENVEVDQTGRTVLRSGNCFRVLNDPNVGSREKFLQFDQYITVCTYQKRLPKELPWVKTIVDQYEYLQEEYESQ